MEKESQLKKLSKCVRTLLELDGLTVPLATVSKIITEEDSLDVNVLKDKVKQSLENNDMREKGSGRRKDIEEFIYNNWSLIKDNETVRTVLFSAYSRGRYSKEKQEEMRKELLNKLNLKQKPKSKESGKYDF